MYPLNAWYAAAWDAEVGRTLLARTVCDRLVVLYRLLTAVRAAWQRAGRPPGGLRFETFGTSGTLPAGPFRVSVPSRGVVVDVPVGTTLLDALEAAGVEVMYDCLRGECGLCRVRVVALEGALDHRDVFLSERQHAEGRELCTCVSRVAGTSITVQC